ncbi:MAG TPA: PAS domain-containing protein [Fodinibius sp.]|nr:PAS domain-containing protein [Fodinibius sp.]
MAEIYNILLIEDDAADIKLIERELNKLDIAIQPEVISSTSELTQQLDRNLPDLIICGHTRPALPGTEALELVRKQYPKLPFIFISTFTDEQKAIDAILAGASDYVAKEHISRLGPAVLREFQNYIADQTRRSQLTKSRSQYESLIQSVNGIVWEADGETLEFNYISPQSERLLGYTPAEWLSQPNFWQNHIHPDDRKQAVDFCYQQSRQGADHTFEYRMITADENIIWLRDYVTVAMINGEPHRLRGLMVDITQQKETEQKLQQSIERFEAASKATSDGIFEWDLSSGIFQHNQNLPAMFGYSEDQMDNHIDWWLDKVHPSDLAYMKNKTAEILTSRKDRMQAEYRLKCGDGSYKYTYSRILIIRDNEQKPTYVVGAIQDISEFKKREQRSHKFQQVISTLSTNRSLLKMDLVDALSEVLQASAQALGVDRASVWLREERKLRCICSYANGNMNMMRGNILSKKDYPTYFSHITEQRITASSDPYNHEAFHELKDTYLKPHNIQSLLDIGVLSSGPAQTIVCHESTTSKYKWQSDEILFAGTITDQVAHLLAHQEKKKKEKQIRKSLREKETLLTEVHHRVKNNLAVVSGLMQLQAYDQDSSKIKDKLFDSVARIQTMAAIHELLYKSDSFSELRLDENVRKLVSSVSKALNAGHQIKLDFNLEAVTLNINQAIPCSLIINEVVTNALKHAFDDDKGIITINLSEERSTIFLSITDNGKGLPDHFNGSAEYETLGFQLINTLATQLEAQYQFSSQNGGTTFSIHFERAKAKSTGSTGSDQV